MKHCTSLFTPRKSVFMSDVLETLCQMTEMLAHKSITKICLGIWLIRLEELLKKNNLENGTSL